MSNIKSYIRSVELRRAGLTFDIYNNQQNNQEIYLPPLLGYDFVNNDFYIDYLIAFFIDTYVSNADVVYTTSNVSDWSSLAVGNDILIGNISNANDFLENQTIDIYVFNSDSNCTGSRHIRGTVLEKTFNSLKIRITQQVGGVNITINYNNNNNHIYFIQFITDNSVFTPLFALNDSFNNVSKLNRYTTQRYDVQHAGATYVNISDAPSQPNTYYMPNTPCPTQIDIKDYFKVFRCYFTNYHALQDTVTSNLQNCILHTTVYNKEQTIALYPFADQNYNVSLKVRTSYPNMSHLSNICFDNYTFDLQVVSNNYIATFNTTNPIQDLRVYLFFVNNEDVLQDNYNFLFTHSITILMNNVSPSVYSYTYIPPSFTGRTDTRAVAAAVFKYNNEWYTVFSNEVTIDYDQFDIVCANHIYYRTYRPLDTSYVYALLDLSSRMQTLDDYLDNNNVTARVDLIVKRNLQNEQTVYTKNVNATVMLNPTTITSNDLLLTNYDRKYKTVFYDTETSNRCIYEDVLKYLINKVNISANDFLVTSLFRNRFYLVVRIAVRNWYDSVSIFNTNSQAIFDYDFFNSFVYSYYRVRFVSKRALQGIRLNAYNNSLNTIQPTPLTAVSLVAETDDEIIFNLSHDLMFVISLHVINYSSVSLNENNIIDHIYKNLTNITRFTDFDPLTLYSELGFQYVSAYPDQLTSTYLTYNDTTNELRVRKNLLPAGRYAVYFRFFSTDDTTVNTDLDYSELYVFEKKIKSNISYIKRDKHECCSYNYIVTSDDNISILTADDNHICYSNLENFNVVNKEDHSLYIVQFANNTNNIELLRRQCCSLFDYCANIHENSYRDKILYMKVKYRFRLTQNNNVDLFNYTTYYSFSSAIVKISNYDIENEKFVSSLDLYTKNIYKIMKKAYDIEIYCFNACEYNQLQNIIMYAENISFYYKNIFVFEERDYVIDYDSVNIEKNDSFIKVTFRLVDAKPFRVIRYNS